jgi:cytochrome c553
MSRSLKTDRIVIGWQMLPAFQAKCALLSTGIMAALAFAATGCQPPKLHSQSTAQRHARSNRRPVIDIGGVVLVGSNDSKPNSITPEARAEALSIFAERCAVCHGVDGDGAGPAASSLNPKPANFRSRKWQSSMRDERIAMIIVNGGQSVGLSASMASNPDLEGRPDVVAALVEHIRQFAK